MKQTAKFDFAAATPEVNMCLNKVPNFWQPRYLGFQHHLFPELTIQMDCNNSFKASLQSRVTFKIVRLELSHLLSAKPQWR